MAATQFHRILSKTCLPIRHNVSSASRHYSTKKTVGFIGVGNMGRPMANNLMKKNHTVIAYDVVPEAINAIKKDGAQIANSPAEIASQADFIVTMLPTNQHVLDCYLGPKGILEGAKKGIVLMDSSTVDPSVPGIIEPKAQEKEAHFVDSPVSGGIMGAQDGTLTFMVGGKQNLYDVVKPVLQAMGSNIVYCGTIGCGQAAKICNNMMLGISMLGLSEALNLGIRLGLDPKLLTSIINTSTGRCWSSEKYNPVPDVQQNVPSTNNYEGGFMSKLMCKDLGLAQDTATRLQCPIPLGAMSHQFYRMLINMGDGDKDFSYVYQYLKGKPIV